MSELDRQSHNDLTISIHIEMFVVGYMGTLYYLLDLSGNLKFLKTKV